MTNFNPSEFEKKWTIKWSEKNINKTGEMTSGKDKFYSLYSYPYPSGAGLHVGHVEGMVANDIVARYERMKGKSVILPMGWDSFGLPAENYAIKTGIHPQKSTDDAVETFKEQINRAGISVDWETEVGAHQKDYYKWTQWIFLRMYQKGLAVKKKAPVNWCPTDQTVLANEQVLADGTCERCGSLVIQKEMEQWFYKITDYAERLLEGLNRIDWPESTKQQQRHWIGKSEGAVIKFEVKAPHDLNSPSTAGLERGLGGEETPHPQPFSNEIGEGSKTLELEVRRSRKSGHMVRARELRSNMTKAEIVLWEALRNNKIGFKVRRQHPVESYIVDFAIPSENLAIELDGEIHKYTKLEDEIRSKRLNAIGFRVIRFKNEEVINNLSQVIERIKKNINSPSPAGLGGEVLFATNNKSKVKRLRMIVEKLGLNLNIKTLEDLGLTEKEVDENGTLEENAISKAKAFFGDVQIPIIAMDTGLFVEGEEMDPVKVKRNALEKAGKKEAETSQSEISEIMIDFYKLIATKNGGEVSGFFRDAVAIVYPDGKEEVKVADRRISLTNQAIGLDEYFPINTLYKIMPLGKHYHDCSEDEIFEWLTGLREIITSFTQQTFIKVFSTRPDTIFGATFLVISPENDLISKNQDKILNLSEIKDYQEQAKGKTELDRQQQKEKTGIKIEGLIAINPANNKEIPIYIADYVLNSYGTGAIMAVPAHDERDFEFAKKYNLEIKEVVAKEYGVHKEPNVLVDGITSVIFNKSNNKYLGLRWKNDKKVTLLAGGTKDKESYIDTLNREIKEEAGIYKFIENHIAVEKFYSNYWHPIKQQQNHSQGIIYLTIVDDTCFLEKTKKEENENFEVEWFSAEELLKEIINLDESEHWINGLKKGLQLNITSGFEKNIKSELLKTDLVTETGILFNSEQFDGLNSEEAKSKITEWLEKKDSAEKKVNYRLRDWLLSRQRYWGCPIPIVYDSEGKAHPVPEEHLPVILPTDVDFKPTGESPLVYSESFHKSAEELYGKGWRREVDTMDTFVDSSWYFFRHIDAKNENEIFSKEKANYWLPTDLYMIGNEHTVLHLLYSRFFTKVLFDEGFISFDEPFQKVRHMGLILGPDGKKMSKRWGNVINPNDEIEKYGADTLRIYEMFMGPLEDPKPWNDRTENGIFRFLSKVWKLSTKVKISDSKKQEKEVNKLIKKVTEDIDSMSFNTAIAKMMEFVNLLTTEEEIPKQVWTKFLLLLAPFAPFLAEELWKKNDGEFSIHQQNWPTYDEDLIKEDEVILVIQVNGKVRGNVKIASGTSEAEAIAEARKVENVSRFLEGEVKKVIFIKDKILNLIV